MTWPLIVRVEAEAELVEASAWYERERPGLGTEFVLAIDRALEAIADTLEGGEVHVVAIAHAKRKPGYWVGRASR